MDYSACDAFASLEMYACAIAKPNSDVRLTSETARPGLGVDYVRNKRVVARGVMLTGPRRQTWHGVRVAANQTVIRLDQVTVPTLMLQPKPLTDLPDQREQNTNPYTLGDWLGLAPNNCLVLVLLTVESA